MTQVVYNGIQFDACRATIEQVAQFDDASGKQYRHTQFTVTVNSTVSPDLNPSIEGETNAGAIVARVRSALLQPRAQLQVWDDDFLILDSPTEGNTVDAAFGPIPRKVNVVEIIGSLCVMVSFVVETYLYECYSGVASTPGTDGFVPAYTTLTWSEQTDIDEDHYTTKTRTGTLTVRADAGQNPDGFRNVVLPPIPNGFLRKSSRYMVTEDQLSLRFTYIDKEQYNLPPPPALAWQGERIASSVNKAGTMWEQEVRVRLRGAKGTPKADLIAAAANVALASLNSNNVSPGASRGNRLLGGTIKDSLHENVVEVVVRQAQIAGVQGTFYGLNSAGLYNVNLDHYAGEDPSQNPAPYDPGTYGTALLPLVGPVLNDPCLNQTLQTANNGQQVAAPPDNNPPATVNTVALLPDQSTVVDGQESQNGIYTEYALVTRYDTDYHTVMLPKVGGDEASFGTVANPTMIRTVMFHATRYDQPPTMPDPNVVDPNSVLLNHSFTVHNATMGADQQSPIYTAEGTLTFGVVDPTQQGLFAGVVPYLSTDYNNSLYSTFSHGIIDEGQDTFPVVGGGFGANPPPDNPVDS